MYNYFIVIDPYQLSASICFAEIIIPSVPI